VDEKEEQNQPNKKKGLSWWVWAGLALLILGLAGLSYALWPMIYYQVSQPVSPYASRLFPEQGEGIPGENRLVIPKILVDTEIVEGENSEALLRGAWREPKTARPGEGGNVVISGHRFLYEPPNNTTFYLLDKLEVGDKLIVYWEGEELDYEVEEMKVVEPHEIDILSMGDEEKLTVYTCTPLFSQAQRLVVLAKPIGE